MAHSKPSCSTKGRIGVTRNGQIKANPKPHKGKVRSYSSVLGIKGSWQRNVLGLKRPRLSSSLLPSLHRDFVLGQPQSRPRAYLGGRPMILESPEVFITTWLSPS